MKTVRLILRLIFQAAHITRKSLSFNRETIGLWSTGEYFLWAAFSLDAIICLSHQRHTGITDIHWNGLSRKTCDEAEWRLKRAPSPLCQLSRDAEVSLPVAMSDYVWKIEQREIIIHETHETGERHKLVTSTAIFATLYFQNTLQNELIVLCVLKRYCATYTTLTPQSLSTVYKKIISLFSSSFTKELFPCLIFMIFFLSMPLISYSTVSVLSADAHFVFPSY